MVIPTVSLLAAPGPKLIIRGNTPIIVDKKLEITPVKNILFLFRVGSFLMTLKVIKKATNIFKKSSFIE